VRTMKQARKIITYIATSADGFIARLDGGVEWLNRPRPPDNYEMGAFYKSIDTILFGRKTYAPFGFQKKKSKPSAPESKIKNYVFTHNPPTEPEPGVEFVNEPISEFAQRLRATPGKDIWMMGGAGVIASFLDEGEIDEFIIHVVPTFIGEGIPLIAPRHRAVELKLLSAKTWPDGLVRLHYAVLPQKAAKRSAKKSPRKTGRTKAVKGKKSVNPAARA